MKTIELVIDDQLLERVSALAAAQNRTVQDLLIQMLNSLDQADSVPTLDEQEYDPITPLIGSLQLGTHDLAENHDDHIGQAFYRQLKCEE